MKTIHVKHFLLLLSVGLMLPLISCSSDSNSGADQIKDSKNSYSITIEGDKNYSNSWNMDAEDGAIISTHNKNLEGDENISLIIADDPKNFSLSGAMMINAQTKQPLALGNLQVSEGAHSTFFITIGTKNYMSNSGSSTLSNLVIKPFTQYTGFASYTMALDGYFDIMETQDIEQIRITGTVITANQF